MRNDILVNVTKLIISFFSVLCTARCFAGTEEELAKLLQEYFQYTPAENIGGVLSNVHTQAPIYLVAEDALMQVFEAYDLKYELILFSLIEEDENYAYGRLI